MHIAKLLKGNLCVVPRILKIIWHFFHGWQSLSINSNCVFMWIDISIFIKSPDCKNTESKSLGEISLTIF